tara:strand:+ start:210 stop:446 length:237 start_codon:yes stop_codon:yes gene_type:complete
MKEKLYLVTDIHFDITDGGNDEDEWTDEEYQSLLDSAIGLWYAEDGDHLCDKITEKTGFCIISIDYTTDTLHPLTSYL